MDDKIDRVFSVKQTAEFLGLGERTLWRMMADGKVQSLKIGARKRGILASEIRRIQDRAAHRAEYERIRNAIGNDLAGTARPTDRIDSVPCIRGVLRWGAGRGQD
jgi:predicted DNA-binding transcriptional regulator AlpA